MALWENSTRRGPFVIELAEGTYVDIFSIVGLKSPYVSSTEHTIVMLHGPHEVIVYKPPEKVMEILQKATELL